LPPTGEQPQPPVLPRPWRRRGGRARLATAAALVTAGLAVGGGVAARGSTTTSTTASPSALAASSAASGSQAAGWSYPYGHGRIVPGGGTAASGSTAQALTAATSAQEVGVVDMNVVLGGTEQAAGTGMVLTSDGEVLTNRHVVEGETSISVTVAATGQMYAARVVGISTTTDVTVVQLTGASGLATVKTASSAVSAAAAVVGVGNAGGTGGTPSAAPGTVTGIDQSITASDTDGSSPEQLSGLIETDAGIQPGDSGGPLLNASNAVVGMDTAASAQGNDAYAIPIATALAVAQQIETGATGTQAGAGTSSSTTTGQHPYLGVQVQDGANGALVDGVVPGSPADDAGLVAGDTITWVAGHTVDSATDLATIMASASAGHSVTVTWTDQNGTTHTAHVTPVASLS
jgi:S1-C subfamily serine protease